MSHSKVLRRIIEYKRDVLTWNGENYIMCIITNLFVILFIIIVIN